MQELREESELYQTRWNRIYAPLRRTLSGNWIRQPGDDRFMITFDAYGGFELKCLDTDTHRAGRYTVVNKAGSHYISLQGADRSIRAYRIADVGNNSLELVDEKAGAKLRLSRRAYAA